MLNTDHSSKFLPEALTFDDILMVPAHSAVLPADINVRTRLAGDIYLNTPLISAAMDTVTESRMAIAMAREGGIGVIHKNMPIRQQADQIDRCIQKMNQASLEFYTPVGEMDISHTLSKMENHLVIVSTAAEKKKVS